MKIVFDRAALAADLKIVGSAIPARASKPVLACVKIESKGDKVYLSATNLERWAESEVSLVDVQSEGVCLVSHAKFDEIIRELSADSVSIELSADKLHIESGKSKFDLLTMKPEDFPSSPRIDAEAAFSLPAALLADMVTKIHPYVPVTPLQSFANNSMLLHVKGKKIFAVGSDGRHLGIVNAEIPEAVDEIQCLVPENAKAMIMRLCEDAEEAIAVHISENQLVLSNSRTRVIMVPVEGKYPDYQKAVRDDYKRKLTAGKREMLDALRPVMTVIENMEDRGETNRRMLFRFHKGGVNIKGKSNLWGFAEHDLDAEYEGDDLEILINGTFLVDALRSCDVDEFTYHLGEWNHATLLQMGPNYRCIIMPLNLKEQGF